MDMWSQCALKRVGRAVEERRRRGIFDTVGGDLWHRAGGITTQGWGNYDTVRVDL